MPVATVEFPSTLPAPLIENYSMSPFQTFERQQVSDGPPRYRLRSPRYTSIFSAQWLLTEGQFQTFRQWFQDFANLNYNRWFLINLAVGLSQSDNTPRVLEKRICHFFEDWSASIDSQSNLWRLQATLESLYQAAGRPEELIISARSIDDPRPADIISARSINEERPADILTSATPGFWS